MDVIRWVSVKKIDGFVCIPTVARGKILLSTLFCVFLLSYFLSFSSTLNPFLSATNQHRYVPILMEFPTPPRPSNIRGKNTGQSSAPVSVWSFYYLPTPRQRSRIYLGFKYLCAHPIETPYTSNSLVTSAWEPIGHVSGPFGVGRFYLLGTLPNSARPKKS